MGPALMQMGLLNGRAEGRTERALLCPSRVPYWTEMLCLNITIKVLVFIVSVRVLVSMGSTWLLSLRSNCSFVAGAREWNFIAGQSSVECLASVLLLGCAVHPYRVPTLKCSSKGNWGFFEQEWSNERSQALGKKQKATSVGVPRA